MANRGSYPNIATRNANQQAMVDAGLAANDTCTVDGVSFTWDGTGWQSPYPQIVPPMIVTPSGNTQFSGAVGFVQKTATNVMASPGTANFVQQASDYPGLDWKYDAVIGAWIPSVATPSPIRVPIDYFGVLGQSVEAGAAKTWVSGQLPRDIGFEAGPYSDPMPGVMSTRRSGSVWPFFAAMCASRGVKIRKLYNGACGSTSMRQHVAGCLWRFNTWGANQTVYGSRAPVGTGDRGDKGDHINITGVGLFQCLIGSSRYVMLDSATPVTLDGGGSYTKLDYLVLGPALKTGATVPNWASCTTVGDTIVDGQLTWKLVAKNFTHPDNSANSSDPFWDPLGMIARVVDNAAGTGLTRVAYIQNSQADTYNDPASWSAFLGAYAQAFQRIAEYFAGLGWTVFVGNSTGQQMETVLSNSYYPSQMAQQAATKAVADAANANVLRGADWFALLGPAPVSSPDTGTTVQGVHPIAKYTPALASDVAMVIIARFNP